MNVIRIQEISLCGIGQAPLAPTIHNLIYYAVFNAFTIFKKKGERDVPLGMSIIGRNY
jgi:hypothetical protein